MPILILPPSEILVSPRIRRFSGPITGGNGQPASGREMLLIGRNEWGRWVVVDQTVTDDGGNYSFSVNSGSNDRFLIVGVGSAPLGEYTRALGNMIGVP